MIFIINSFQDRIVYNSHKTKIHMQVYIDIEEQVKKKPMTMFTILH